MCTCIENPQEIPKLVHFVAEDSGHHLLAAGPDHRARLPVLHPGLDGVLLDTGESY